MKYCRFSVLPGMCRGAGSLQFGRTLRLKPYDEVGLTDEGVSTSRAAARAGPSLSRMNVWIRGIFPRARVGV